MALFRSLIRAFSEKALSSDRPELVRDETALVGNSIRRRLGTLLSDLHALNTVTLTNNYVASVHSRTAMFATLFFGVLDPYTGVLTYVNGGHEAPIILGVNGVKARLRPTGPAVGMMPGMEFDIEEAHLEPGDVFFGYSDGVTDAKDPAGQRFTEARLLELLAQPVLSVSTLLDNIEAAVRSHIAGASQFDDITMLSLRRATLVEKSESCSGPRVTDPSPL
jgi:sigma-B regulation protein RsbU (phosphoserine phosphatase)